MAFRRFEVFQRHPRYHFLASIRSARAKARPLLCYYAYNEQITIIVLCWDEERKEEQPVEVVNSTARAYSKGMRHNPRAP